MKVWLFVACWLLLPALELAGQSANVAFRNISSKEGLPNTSVSDISQDALGFIWISTWDGVYRFDGENYLKISDEDCRRLAADDKGGMWMSFTDVGTVGYYNNYTDSLRIYKLADDGRSPDIAIDGNGVVWIGSSRGLLKLEAASDTFLLDSPKMTFEAMYLSARGKGELIFAFRNPESNKFQIGIRYSDGQYGIEDFPIDQNNPLPGISFVDSYPPFGMTFNQELDILIINKNGWAVKNRFDGSWKFNKPEDKSIIGDFRAHFLDRDNNLWLSQENSLSRIDIAEGQVTVFTHDPRNRESILPYSNLGAGGHIFRDRQGILWITRYGHGISRLNLFDSDFGLVRDEGGKPVTDVLSAVELEDRSFFIGSRRMDYGLYHIDKNGHIIKRYGASSVEAPKGRSVSTELSHPFVWSLIQSRDGSIWAGTGWPRSGQGGLNRFRVGSDEITRFKMDPENENSLPDDWVIRLLEDGSGRIWVSTVRNGWAWIDPETEQIMRAFQEQDLFRNPIEFGYGFINREGNLVFKADGHFFEVNHKDLNISRFAPEIKSTDPLYYLLQDEFGRYWFVSNDGFGYLNDDVNEIAFFFPMKENNFPADEINTINVDDLGNAWLATSNGIVKFDPVSGEYTHFGFERGLQGNYFRGQLNFKGPSGKIYFAGNAGVNIIDPDKIKINPFPPDMLFTGLKLDGIPAVPEMGSVITKPVIVADQAVIGPDVSFITIDFAAIHFAGEGQNLYQFMMEGYDEEWRDGGTHGQATYTNLPHGKYNFKIRGSNWDGVWSDGSKSIQIIILPPWWKTWWAYGIYAMIFIFLGFQLHLYQKKRTIRKERERSQQRELEQAREIEKAYTSLKATQSQLIHAEKMASLGELTAGIAHEIQNPLNFVNNFSDVSVDLLADLQQESEAGNTGEVSAIIDDLKQNLEKISNHGKRASGIVKGMLEHSRSGSSEKQPTDISALADEYLRLAYHGLRAKDKSFNADFRLEADDGLPEINVVGQEIGRVLLNLINNAFYAVSEKAKLNPKSRIAGGEEYKPLVIVSIKKKEDKIEIRVEDNGKGIPENIRHKIFQPFFTTKPSGEGTGLGLSLSYDIIKKGHNGDLRVESENTKGTTFVITLPI